MSSQTKGRENWVGGIDIPTPTTKKLLALGRAYMNLLRAESTDAWDMEQLARYEETWKYLSNWEERAKAYRAVGVALDAIEEGAE